MFTISTFPKDVDIIYKVSAVDQFVFKGAALKVTLKINNGSSIDQNNLDIETSLEKIPRRNVWIKPLNKEQMVSY